MPAEGGPTRIISTAITSFLISRVSRRSRRARSSSTSTTMANLWLSGCRIGRWFLRAADRRYAGYLARTIHVYAGADHVQPAHGSLRASRDHLEHLQRLFVPAFVPCRARTGARKEVRRYVQRIPAASKALEFQRRSDHGAVGEASGG